MGIKCSLLGHAFEESDVERERAERGDEVVTVVREVERCARCGKERVVSENTEVTAVIEPDEVPDDAEPSASADAGTEAEAGNGGTEPSGEAMSGIVDRADAGGDGDVVGGPEEEFEPPDDPAEEDAEILEGDHDTAREPGQWPDDDEPFDPEGLAESPEPEPAVEPVEGEGDDTTDVADDPATEERATEEPRATLGGVDAETAEYVCPECGFVADASTSSLREGDACPECGVGWLRVERNR